LPSFCITRRKGPLALPWFEVPEFHVGVQGHIPPGHTVQLALPIVPGTPEYLTMFPSVCTVKRHGGLPAVPWPAFQSEWESEIRLTTKFPSCCILAWNASLRETRA
jgi:hypothetical protein